MASDPKRLGAKFDAHTDAEFNTRDLEATMATMAEAPHVTHVPTMTGGSGYDAVRHFYENYFVGRVPADWSVKLISRTIGENQLVDEVLISFTHDCDMPAILPGVKPTGRKVVIPFVVVVGFDKDEKVAFERIYWDQARAPSRRAACSIQPCRRTHLFLKIEVSSLRLLPPRRPFALRLGLNLPWRLVLRRPTSALAEGAPEMRAEPMPQPSATQ
jgi:carboxymethylenebutenolidase